MTARLLVDTNVLVYAYDSADAARQEKAFAILDELATNGRGVLSVQVLAEFVVAVTRKIAVPLDVASARKSVENYLRSAFKVVGNRQATGKAGEVNDDNYAKGFPGDRHSCFLLPAAWDWAGLFIWFHR